MCQIVDCDEKLLEQAQEISQEEKERLKKERIKQYKKDWSRKNRHRLNAAAKKYYKAHAEEIRQYHRDNKDRYNRNKKKRYEKSAHFRNQINYYSQIRRLINTYKAGRTLKTSKIETIIGLTKLEFIKHLESTLPKGKTIAKDYGWGKFEVDHIIPCHMFDLGDMEQVKMCFNWRNLRLIKRKENLSRKRKNKYVGDN